MAYKGMMPSGVPNCVFTIGYTNASWTLKADLVSEFTCRLLRYMDAHGYDTCVPVNNDPSVTERPLLDLSAVTCSVHRPVPAGRRRAPWRLGTSYANDVVTLRHGKKDDGSLRFSRLDGAEASRGAGHPVLNRIQRPARR